MRPDYLLITDGSVKISGDQNFSAYAAVIVNVKTNQYTTISGPISNRSIVYCEAFAIYQGLRYLKKLHKNKKIKVAIISDSKLVVMTFSYWINNSWDTSDWYHWKKSDKSEVMNQELYRKMVTIINSKCFQTVRFIHINGHGKDHPKLRKRISAKLGEFGVNVDNDTVDIIINMNGIADELAHGIVSKDSSKSNYDIIQKLKRK